MSASLIFSTVSPSQYQALRSAVTAQGIFMPAAPLGVICSHGCKIRYTYDATGQVLTLAVISAPFGCTSLALGQLHHLVTSALAAPSTPSPHAPVAPPSA